jgi:glycerol-1-phosphate dehydrogenase [NAD(P)+]
MNGYTSSMAALSNLGIKQTLTVEPARAIFADLDILKEAPVEMVRAGLGDIVSKSVCNADWKLSHLIKGTYFCPVPFRITDKTEPGYLHAAAEIGARSDAGIRALTDGVLRSGLSMTVIGTSTPSSGAEHLLSHFWDLVALMEGSKKQLHGVHVGVSTVIMQRVYEYVGNVSIYKSIDLKKLARSYPALQDMELFLDRKFGAYAPGVKEQFAKKYLPWEQKKAELERIVDGWDKLWDEIAPFVRPPGPVQQALEASGAASRFQDLGMSRDQALDALMHARLIRWRYTILDLAADLGLLEGMAQKLL